MVNSGFLNGLTNKADSIAKMIEYLTEKGIGEGGVQYKMKDWAFNRQRYWGEPIPIVHCPHCGMVAVPYEELPLKLPAVENFEPGSDGESPLAKIDSFVNCKCPKCGGDAKRETDTMPQWAGSSWYFLRYVDPHNDKALADYDKLKYWMPVDWYNGGMEHVTRHLIYSRFWHRFLYDIGVVPCAEPYAKRTAQGLILGPDGVKMSKSTARTCCAPMCSLWATMKRRHRGRRAASRAASASLTVSGICRRSSQTAMRIPKSSKARSTKPSKRSRRTSSS